MDNRLDNRVQNGPARIATNSAVPNAVGPARNALAPQNATLNTVDATAFTSRPATGNDLDDMLAIVAELEARIEALEAQVASMQGADPAAPAQLNGGPAVRDFGEGAAQAPLGLSLPPLNGPAPGASVALADQPATANGRLAADIQDDVAARRADAARTGNQLATRGLEGVEHVLRGAKLTGLTPHEEQIVDRALRRVHEIGGKISAGEDPGKYAAELFALKHTLADPAGAGRHPAVTAGAQTVGYIEEQKAALADKIADADRRLGRRRDPALLQEIDRLNARYKALVDIEKALDGAKLTGLTPAAERTAAGHVDRLALIAEAVAGGAASPTDVEGEVYRLGQALRGTDGQAAPAATIDAGADVVAKISGGKARIHQRLRELDERIMGGSPPALHAAERARLLANAEALDDLGDAVKAARVAQGDARARREIGYSMAKAAALAEAIGSGAEDASNRRAELFALRQAFLDPSGSKDNPAIQAGAAALQLIGQAEGRNLAARQQIAAGAANGRDNRRQDPQLAALNRQGDDLELLRQGIELADLSGLTPAQEARGAEIIDQMRAIALRVADGEDFGQHRAAYDALAGELASLRRWRGGPAPGPADIPAPPPPPLPPPPAPPAPPAPADNGPRPGRTYVVKKGDWLTKIARDQLGDERRFTEIVALNKDRYPSLATNPDLIQPGWELVLPADGAPAPADVKPPRQRNRPRPQPAPPVAPPPPAPPAGNAAEREAVAWVKRNLDADGRISRDQITRNMPAGPAKDALLANYDVLLFGFIDAGREGWTHLHRGDVERLEKGLAAGLSIADLAEQLAYIVIQDRKLGDLNKDGKIDEGDVKLHAEQLRGAPTDAPRPADTPQPSPDAQTARLRADLDVYLNNKDNQDADGVRHLLRNAPQYVVVATPEQKGRMLKWVSGERGEALRIMRMAEERGELVAVLKEVKNRRGLDDLLSELGDSREGLEAARLMLKAGAYKEESIWREMDDDAVAGLVKALGFREPMIGTNDELRALPEAAKHFMIKQLLGGNLTWGELAMAEWINAHTELPYRIPDYRNR